MPVVDVRVPILAPMELCFDLARDVDLHIRSTEGTGERAVAGVTSGLMGPGQEVTWEATHFGIRQRLTSRITHFDRPHRFRDSQVSGPFRRFDHDHIFSQRSGVTVMFDIFDYEAPLSVLGRLADRLFLEDYLKHFLTRRALVIKEEAEALALKDRPNESTPAS